MTIATVKNTTIKTKKKKKREKKSHRKVVKCRVKLLYAYNANRIYTNSWTYTRDTNPRRKCANIER